MVAARTPADAVIRLGRDDDADLRGGLSPANSTEPPLSVSSGASYHPTEPLDDDDTPVFLVEAPAGWRIEATPHRACLTPIGARQYLGRCEGLGFGRHLARFLVECDETWTVGQDKEEKLKGERPLAALH